MLRISALSHFAGNDPHYGRQLYQRMPKSRIPAGFSDALNKAVDEETQQKKQIRLRFRELALNGSRESESIPVMKAEEEEEDEEALSEPPQNAPRREFTGTIRDKEKGYYDLRDTAKSGSAQKSKKPVIYNYREVASKIRQAKTSSAAGRAVLSAKRKVLELKRKVSSGEGDPEELQLALTHAKRMELTARKKKRHLEMEELAEILQKREEGPEKSSSDPKDQFFIVKEEDLTKKEEEIFREREELFGETTEKFRESGEPLTEDMLSALSEAVSELGEEELEMLEEAMELLENMELLDPHMSAEELEELKRKHRDAENKAMLKADMDYLKGLMKHLDEQKGSPGALYAAGSVPGGISPGLSAAVSAPAADAGAAVDVAV